MRTALLLLSLVAAAAAAGTQWALLIAGSSTYANYHPSLCFCNTLRSYANYRHQSDVYHAYQLMLQVLPPQ